MEHLTEKLEKMLGAAKIATSVFMVSIMIFQVIIFFGIKGGYTKALPLSEAVISSLLVAALISLILAPRAGQSLLAVTTDHSGFYSFKRLAGYNGAIIFSLAYRAIPAINGFVLSYLTSNIYWSFGLGAVSLISMVRNWPKREKLKKLFPGSQF